MKLSFLKSKETKNAAWIIAEQVFQMLISFLISILSARYLGPSNYGMMNYTASFVAFVNSIVTLGLEGVLIKKMIADPDAEGAYLGTAMGMRLCSSVLSGMAIISVVFFLNPGDMLMVTLISLQSIQLIFQAINILETWFQRYLQAKYISIAKMISCILVSGYKIYLLVTAKDIRWFAFSNSLSVILITVVLCFLYRKKKKQKLSFSSAKGKEMITESYHFILSGLMTAMYGQMDKIMLGEMISKEAVGYYNLASSLCGMWIFIPIAIINSFKPSILEEKLQGREERYLSKLKKLYGLIIVLCIGVSAIVSVFGEFGVTLLYGESYIQAVAPLKIIIWCEVFSMIGTARGIWILAENMNRYVKYYLGIGVVVNLMLNVLLIPSSGIIGAAAATLVTQITTSLIAPLFFKETRIHTKIVYDSIVMIFNQKVRRK